MKDCKLGRHYQGGNLVAYEKSVNEAHIMGGLASNPCVDLISLTRDQAAKLGTWLLTWSEGK